LFCVRFWGVRGSIACCSPAHIKYGGNTSCVEIAVGDHRFVLDAGTGIRALSKVFVETDVRTIHLLLSHTHLDHIVGFPFFRPAYDGKRRLSVHAGHLKQQGGVESVLSQQMADPVFPVPLDAMKAIVEFQDFDAGDAFHLYPDVNIRTAPLNHPNGATGYRIEHAGMAACYVTDTEHIPGRPDQNILGLIEGADLVIYDSTYTEAEFPRHVGWGHSTWNEGMRLCRMAGAQQLAIFHHEPDHTDMVMDRIEGEARAAWPGAFVAREGMEVRLDPRDGCPDRGRSVQTPLSVPGTPHGGASGPAG
jgi:phosphoribosyl 1,2-cyclic phosphodiesterase